MICQKLFSNHVKPVTPPPFAYPKWWYMTKWGMSLVCSLHSWLHKATSCWYNICSKHSSVLSEGFLNNPCLWGWLWLPIPALESPDWEMKRKPPFSKGYALEKRWESSSSGEVSFTLPGNQGKRKLSQPAWMYAFYANTHCMKRTKNTHCMKRTKNIL